jgi:hypothetical protein
MGKYLRQELARGKDSPDYFHPPFFMAPWAWAAFISAIFYCSAIFF